MLCVKQSVKLLAMTQDPLALIELAGRTCYKSEHKMSAETAEKFVRARIKDGHASILEHASATVRFIVDRGVSHEIVRHRIASYSQESTRYCNYSGRVTFIIPLWVSIEPGEYNLNKFPALSATSRMWLTNMLKCELEYTELTSRGVAPENARAILPNSLKTELIMTANFREWRHFLALRTSKAAHPQMREVANKLLDVFNNAIPVVFEDIIGHK